MDVIYGSTVITEAYSHGIVTMGIFTLTWKYHSLSCYRHFVDESLTRKCIDDTVECGEIHMSTRDERLLQIRKSDTRRLLELFDEATTRHGDTRGRHSRMES